MGGSYLDLVSYLSERHRDVIVPSSTAPGDVSVAPNCWEVYSRSSMLTLRLTPLSLEVVGYFMTEVLYSDPLIARAAEAVIVGPLWLRWEARALGSSMRAIEWMDIAGKGRESVIHKSPSESVEFESGDGSDDCW